MANKRFVHDPDCAVTKDVASAPDQASDKGPPKCTCKKRQKARLRYHVESDGYIGSLEGHEPLGEGNYRHRVLNSEW